MFIYFVVVKLWFLNINENESIQENLDKWEGVSNSQTPAKCSLWMACLPKSSLFTQMQHTNTSKMFSLYGMLYPNATYKLPAMKNSTHNLWTGRTTAISEAGVVLRVVCFARRKVTTNYTNDTAKGKVNFFSGSFFPRKLYFLMDMIKKETHMALGEFYKRCVYNPPPYSLSPPCSNSQWLCSGNVVFNISSDNKYSNIRQQF